MTAAGEEEFVVEDCAAVPVVAVVVDEIGVGDGFGDGVFINGGFADGVFVDGGIESDGDTEVVSFKN